MSVKKTKVWDGYCLGIPTRLAEDSNGIPIQIKLVPIIERKFAAPNGDRINLCVYENGVWAVITVKEGVQSEIKLWPYRWDALKDFGNKYKKYLKRDIATAKKEKGFSLVAKKKVKADYDIGIVVVNEIDREFLKRVAVANSDYIRRSLGGLGPSPQEFLNKLLAGIQEDWDNCLS